MLWTLVYRSASHSRRDTFDLFSGVRSLDGKRFLVERYDSEAFTEPIRLIRSWRKLVEK